MTVAGVRKCHASTVRPLSIIMSYQMRQIIFLGGIFTPAQTQFVQANSKGVIQNAADGLQKEFLEGLQQQGRTIVAVNLPFVGSFPHRFTHPLFPASREQLQSTPIIGRGFINLPFLKLVSRYWSALTGLVKAGRSGADVVVYSAHLPFLLSALTYRAFTGGTKVCLIVPDLPEYMGEGGLAYRAFKAVDTKLFYFLSRRVDSFVLLTRFMADRLELRPEQYVVVEGIAAPASGNPTPSEQADDDADTCVFLYTGTLAARYGIVNLVTAFRSLSDPKIRLWISGDGDSRNAVVAAAAADSRIRYFGQVSREKARELQAQATVLVNPRKPEGIYTKYSFPSKTLEYMTTGRPVLMYHLDGIPDDYLPFFLSPKAVSIEGLAEAMQSTAAADSASLRQLGEAARNFVLTHKVAGAQASKVVDLLDRQRQTADR